MDTAKSDKEPRREGQGGAAKQELGEDSSLIRCNFCSRGMVRIALNCYAATAVGPGPLKFKG